MFIKSITLTKLEQQQLHETLFSIQGSPYGASFESFYSQVSPLEIFVPERICSSIRQFCLSHSEAGVLIIRKIPINVSTIPTPTIPYTKSGCKSVGTEKYLLLLAGMLGKLISFDDWHQGEKLQNLYPIPDLRTIQCASNSVYLEMHTETAFRQNTPTYLALLCLKSSGMGEAKTIFCDLRQIINSMNRHQQKVLASASFCFHITSDTSEERFTEPKAVDTQTKGKRQINYAEALTAINIESQEVLLELKERIKKDLIEVELEPGDLVLIDNFRVIHGRTAFSPSFDGTDRWLQRVLITSIA